MKILFYTLIAFLFLALGVHSNFPNSPTKKVIVHCLNFGDGWGDASSALFIAMKFKKLGFQVYLVNHESFLPMDNEISNYFKIFEPLLESFYCLTRNDIFFYTENPRTNLQTSKKEGFLTIEELFRFLPDPSENLSIVYCPFSQRSEAIDSHYPNVSQISFSEFGLHTFPCDPDSILTICGIYIYDKEQLQEIANNANPNEPFIQLIERQKQSQNSKFYFTYFGSQKVGSFPTADVISHSSRFVEYLNFVAFLEEEEEANSSDNFILMAFKNPGPSVSKHLFNDLSEFINYETGKMIRPNKLWKLEEISKRLQKKYSRLFCIKNPEKISIIFYESLSDEVFLWAIQQSEDFVGCTGDDSFSRVISMGKIPLYHALNHKMELKASFVNFIGAQNLSQLASIFSNFIDEENVPFEETRFNEILQFINRSELLKEMQEFKNNTIEIIKRDYSLFDRLLKAPFRKKIHSLLPR